MGGRPQVIAPGPRLRSIEADLVDPQRPAGVSDAVHFVALDGTCAAATVTVSSGQHAGLFVMHAASVTHALDVPHAEPAPDAPYRPRTWHWPGEGCS